MQKGLNKKYCCMTTWIHNILCCRKRPYSVCHHRIWPDIRPTSTSNINAPLSAVSILKIAKLRLPSLWNLQRCIHMWTVMISWFFKHFLIWWIRIFCLNFYMLWLKCVYMCNKCPKGKWGHFLFMFLFYDDVEYLKMMKWIVGFWLNLSNRIR